MKAVVISALALVVLGDAQDDKLLQYPPSFTEKNYESALENNWVKVYYEVNNDLMQMKIENSPSYSHYTWLYGTTQLPPKYDSTWGSGYQERKEEDYKKTASTESSDSEDDSDSDNSHHSESDSDSSSSSASKVAYSSSAFALGAIGAMVAVVSSFV
ncbi:hypothetical protein FB645_001869 [Coemansia sp. IMI 203386]|nr:hypothetical protein FB645_001869 [Coemansia sp. IMI 203386]